MADFSTTHHLVYYSGSSPTDAPGVVNNNPFDTVVVDNNNDGDIDSTDYFYDNSINYSGTTVTINGSDYAVFSDGFGGYYIPYDIAYDNLGAFTDTSTWSFNSVPENAAVVNCFLTGTRIATPSGETAVEDLRIGDVVTTADGRTVEVKWMARQTYRQFRNMALPEKHAPVCISAGALGHGLPHNDLYLTADHGMILDDMVVNAGAMVNGDTIRFVPLSEMPAEFTYYHVETEHHDEILANGAASETFIDYVGRKGFDNYLEYLDLYGADRIIPEMKRLRVSAKRLLPPQLAQRLGAGLEQNAA
ncbi:Hint domain-containing protein [Sulfitobacter pseudonitzschiae]|uniref:Hint domain-containing protein n=2 Tax=Pseudosulfitobacter pseudonitzschiae TaxID=1402135 RepID=A0A9Q2NNG3_9RHOB|nr:Hint domain-containing protein [Pseudosulfitobacter pseudonitzschiae]MBM2292695.1 Hint domain-containing protein [Pseudosulfitobacter pseudonitzschiae]MBM2298209.1 Hint domain-containing protein [Pseudosulfitobacter pseudonitzschiae]MBM2303123.1 Hint domain-containing protein [Pseudosulfitobacter pseudonitzschiae]MBM2312906.1 Hint domain-containing protein [Pseudosulfitobacter pseudonitzschiae]MBM2317819.1 Hint domain-containing protein [Pseudosulfitobacter pseudonitzschiae]